LIGSAADGRIIYSLAKTVGWKVGEGRAREGPGTGQILGCKIILVFSSNPASTQFNTHSFHNIHHSTPTFTDDSLSLTLKRNLNNHPPWSSKNLSCNPTIPQRMKLSLTRHPLSFQQGIYY
jgi:hypothetical protein